MIGVPVIRIHHLTQAQKCAYIITDNRLTERVGWDKELLAVEFKFLAEIDLDFDVGTTGFDTAEIDLPIEGVEGIEAGMVYLPEKVPWLAAFESELAASPNGKHDDQVDSLAQFLRALDLRPYPLRPLSFYTER